MDTIYCHFVLLFSVDNQTGTTEKVEDPKTIKNSHIEVQFQDSNCNFFCRVYMAHKFAELRSLVLPIREEGYIRSLSRSVQWNARGGKSGSNFAKTAGGLTVFFFVNEY